MFYLLTVHYEGTLAETGEVFDTTHEDNSIFSFEIGSGTVIKAWDIALRTMKVIRQWNYWYFPFNALITCSYGFINVKYVGWRGSKNYLQARVCLWKCWFSPRNTTEVKFRTCLLLFYSSYHFELNAFAFICSLLDSVCRVFVSKSLGHISTHMGFQNNGSGCLWCSATLMFEVELVSCRPRKGASLGSVSDEKARLE